MGLRRIGVMFYGVMLLLGGMELPAKETVSYRLIFEESLHSVWVTDVAPVVTVSSSSGLKLHDKVKGEELKLSRTAAPLGVDGNNMADFCIEAPKEPICREVIISDFSYSGLEGVLLGNRGERLQYIVLAECQKGERNCRYPHLQLGPNPIFKLLKKGIRVHTLQEKENDLIVVGPYPKERAALLLPLVRDILPEAFLY